MPRLIALVAVVAPTLVHASGWMPTNGPPGAFVATIAFDPLCPQIAYAGTVGSGIFKSIDGGGSWSLSSSGLRGDGIVSQFAFDPGDTNHIWAANSFEVHQSVDGGQSWFSSSTGISASPIHSIAVAPTSPSVLYVGINGAPGSIFKSSDGGATWQDSQFPGPAVTALVVDPRDENTVYVATSSPGTSDGGIWKTQDGGLTWFRSSAGLINRQTISLAIDPATPSTLYAGVTTGQLGDPPTGVFQSLDSGRSWALHNLGLPDHQPVVSIVVDPNNNQTLYASLQPTRVTGSVFKSTDGGQTWSATGAGNPGDLVYGIAIDSSSQKLLAGTAQTVFSSPDQGANWSASGVGLHGRSIVALSISPASTTILYSAATLGGLFMSTDSGNTWAGIGQASLPGDLSSVVTHPTDPNIVYVGSDLFSLGGVFKSSDAGNTWQKVTRFSSVTRLAVDPQNPSTVYAGTVSNGIYKSADGGASWSLTPLSSAGGYYVQAIAINPAQTSILFAGTFTSGGVYRSMDGGASWQRVYGDDSVWTLAIDTQATLYAGTTHGVIQSTDLGQTWQATGLSEFALTLTPDPQTAGVLYATVYTDILKTTDAGQTWRSVSSGVYYPVVPALSVDPSAPQVLYAGTSTGVYRSLSGGEMP